MPYKNYEKQKEKALERYYKNREKRIEYQKEYDKRNKEKKNKYEKRKRRGKAYNKKKKLQHYAQKNILPVLLKKHKKCQLNLDGCLKDKKLEVHHKKYTKKVEDCLLVCINCHKKIHSKNIK